MREGRSSVRIRARHGLRRRGESGSERVLYSWKLTIIVSLFAQYLVIASVTWVLVHGLRRIASGTRLVDVPGKHSSHINPTPRGGGLAIVAVVLVTLALRAVVLRDLPAEAFWYGVCAILVAAVSFADDIQPVSARLRLLVHLIAAGGLLVGGVHWDVIVFPVFGEVSLGYWGAVFTVIWLVGLTNAYNFMDGIDAIAAGQAIVTGLGWTAVGWLTGNPFLLMLGLSVAATSSGFVLHNRHPAHIFLGHIGSAFLGYTFAALAVIGSRHSGPAAWVGVLFVWPFVFDATFTFYQRWRRGEPVLETHRCHFYQRMFIAGWSQPRVTTLYVCVSLAVTLPALGWMWGYKWLAWPTLVSPGVAALLLFGTTRWIERRRQ